MPADYVWTFSTELPIGTNYLSDWNWTYMANGWGPVEKDQSNGEQATGDGRVITLNGVTYAKGLGGSRSLRGPLQPRRIVPGIRRRCRCGR